MVDITKTQVYGTSAQNTPIIQCISVTVAKKHEPMATVPALFVNGRATLVTVITLLDLRKIKTTNRNAPMRTSTGCSRRLNMVAFLMTMHKNGS